MGCAWQRMTSLFLLRQGQKLPEADVHKQQQAETFQLLSWLSTLGLSLAVSPYLSPAKHLLSSFLPAHLEPLCITKHPHPQESGQAGPSWTNLRYLERTFELKTPKQPSDLQATTFLCPYPSTCPACLPAPQ